MSSMKDSSFGRFLSRRDKDSPRKAAEGHKRRHLSGDGILNHFRTDEKKKIEKEDMKKIQTIKQKLQADADITTLDDNQIHYALNTKYASGDAERAFDILVLFQESVDGIIKPYNPNINLLGAENRDGVTCYLDALLFSMFARLGSFEPILYTTFDDEPRRRLSTMIRLWVNMLRTGKLIQTDMTKHLQDALAACGWEEAGESQQQDTSEAFGFITEKLQLPLLTLKMDIYHTGKEEQADDHKFVNERVLEVAVPPDPGNGKGIPLEDCLEEYFNNRIEVVRGLERTNTHTSVRTNGEPEKAEKGTPNLEVSSMNWSPAQTPTSIPEDDPDSPSTSRATSPISAKPPLQQRTSGLIRRRWTSEEDQDDVLAEGDPSNPRHNLRRKRSVMRKEVLMPAWQFFSLIPWYTDNAPTSDAQVAAHFSSTRPVLGVCLKRYAMTNAGNAVRQNTYIDIPLQIALPHFISEDKPGEDGPPMSNFKLTLQSVVCHRGNSVHSGHYISLIRGTPPPAEDEPSALRRVHSERPPGYSEDRWMKFDDLAKERVSYVDIDQAMKEEMPYLLFYQVQPLYDVGPPSVDLEHEPPSYTDSAIEMTVREPSPAATPASYVGATSYFDGASEEPKSRVSFSDDTERPRRSLNLPDIGDFDRRGSVAMTDASLGSASSIKMMEAFSAPVTPSEESGPGRISRAASRFTKSGSKSRSGSQAGDRKSGTFSRLVMMRSKEPLNKPDLTVTDITSTDGAADGKDGVQTTDFEPASEEGRLGRKRSKKGKNREKSKGRDQSKEKDKEKVGGLEDRPERQCRIM